MDLSEVYFVGGDLSAWLALFRQMPLPINPLTLLASTVRPLASVAWRLRRHTARRLQRSTPATEPSARDQDAALRER